MAQIVTMGRNLIHLHRDGQCQPDNIRLSILATRWRMKRQRYLPVHSVQSPFHLGLHDYPCLKNLRLQLFETSRLPNCLGADQTSDSRMGGGDPGNHVTRLIDICLFAVASRDRALHGEYVQLKTISPYFSFQCWFKPKPITPSFHQRPVIKAEAAARFVC